MNQDLIAQLKRHEGFRAKPYQCSANKTTIGYGRNLQDVGITEGEAVSLLNNDIQIATVCGGDIRREGVLDGIVGHAEVRLDKYGFQSRLAASDVLPQVPCRSPDPRLRARRA